MQSRPADEPRFSTAELIAALADLPFGAMKTEKPWGFEQDLSHQGLDFTLKRLIVKIGHRTSLQVHEAKDELIIVLGPDGPHDVMCRGFIELAPVGKELGKQDMTLGVYHIPPGVVHRVTGPLEYLEVSTYHPADVVRLADDYGR